MSLTEKAEQAAQAKKQIATLDGNTKNRALDAIQEKYGATAILPGRLLDEE